MHHHAYLVKIQISMLARQVLYPKAESTQQELSFKVGFRSLANAGAKGQSFIPQLRRFGESNLGGKTNKDFS